MIKQIAETYQNIGCSMWKVKSREEAIEAIEAWKTNLKFNPKQRYAKKNLKEFANEYGMPSMEIFEISIFEMPRLQIPSVEHLLL